MSNSFKRRDFIKKTAIVTVGTAMLLDPLTSFAAPPKKFKKKSAFNFFVSNDSEDKYFIYTADDFNKDEFEIAKAFSPEYFPFSFIIVFHVSSVVFNSSLNDLCRNNLQGKRIIWISNPNSNTVPDLPSIQFHNNQLQLIDISLLTNNDIFINKENISDNAEIIYDDTRDAFVINALAGKRFSFFANNQFAFFNQFEIRLSHSVKSFNTNTQITKNSGSLRFLTTEFKSNNGRIIPIKPFAPYILPKTTNTVALYVDYFEEKSFAENINLIVTFFPFRDFHNDSQACSYIELLPKKCASVVYTNYLDQFGKQYIVKDFSSFLCRLAIFRISDKADAKYIYIPYNKLALTNQVANKASQVLIGYSGTERIINKSENLDIVFVPSKNLKVNPSNDGLLPIFDSLTSKVWFSPKDYCFDADKSPLFKNEEGVGVSANSKQVPYEAIEIGKLGATVINENSKTLLVEQIMQQHTMDVLETKIQPIIPFMSFTNPDPAGINEVASTNDLIELENAFSKIRLDNFRHLARDLKEATKQSSKQTIEAGHTIIEKPETAKSYVTPQGFVRNPNNSIDFIKQETIVRNGNRSQFTIEGVDLASDFYSSLNKEDVFFVLKPKMLNDKKQKVHIRFTIKDFTVDLTDFFRTPSSPAIVNKETYLIFKFSKYTFADLLSEPSKWSNYGEYKNSISELKGGISKQIQDFKGSDYSYFLDNILNDKNWNGIVILNIPITDRNNLPKIFEGLTSSQKIQPDQKDEKTPLETGLNFKYVALPVNKTFINKGKIEIKSTSIYGLIDYDLLKDTSSNDYIHVKNYLNDQDNNKALTCKFLMTKLLVKFENSEIRDFKSYVFLQVKSLFDDNISGFRVNLNNKDDNSGDSIDKLIRLKGSYQKNNAGLEILEEFTFSAKLGTNISFEKGNILSSIDIDRIGFSYSSGNTYRFDIDAGATFASEVNTFKNLLSFDSLKFGNIGLKFDLSGIKIPKIDFDPSKIFVLPKISFNGDGFLSSFPIKFNRFQVYNILENLEIPDFDFWDFKEFNLKVGKCSLWTFVFDFDLGTLGDLSFLKALKGELAVGWCKSGGFKLGFKLNGPSKGGFHIDLFGALKIDIKELNLCQQKRLIKDEKGNNKEINYYVLRMVDARITILGLEIPNSKHEFNALIFASPGNKVAWLVSYLDKEKNKLSLGIGQRVGLPNPQNITVDGAIEEIKKEIFNPDKTICGNQAFLDQVYMPSNNWLVASENIIPGSLSEKIDLKFIFNDPVLYGIYISIIGLFSIDILYKKLSDDLGIWSLEFALDPSLRTIDAGELVITLPNLGIDIPTQGDWRLDVGFPKGNDWSRSCLIQFRPFVGWGGMYVSRLKTASLSLFAPHYTECVKNTTIFQVGFAVRIGIGAYLDKGVFYVGASISVYGILEGAFAFEKNKGGLSQLLPDHFALMGRVGAIAELIGYVDFKIIKASIHIVLRVEFGMTIYYVQGHLQPVPLYIEGEVTVEIDFTIACFSVFGHHICITIHLSFHAYVRFAYTLGGTAQDCKKFLPMEVPTNIIVSDLKDIPVIFIPTFTATSETSDKPKYLVCNFAIPFFGIKLDDKSNLVVGKNNILKDKILKPFFEAIYTAFKLPLGGEMQYEQLRNIILKGKLDGTNIKFSFPSYRPAFIVGYNKQPLVLDEEYSKFLKTHFKFNDNEIPLFMQNSANDIYRPIPIPVGSQIQVINKDKTNPDLLDEFTISVKGITSTDIPDIVFKKDKTFPKEKLKTIQDELNNSYKTQFDSNGSVFNEATYDLQEDLMIPEYFQLMGLLALEEYNNFIHGQDTNRKGDKLDLKIKIADFLNDDLSDNSVKDRWVFNNHVTNIIGQLNYLNNNGLRFKDKDDQYKSIYSLLKQTSELKSDLTDANYTTSSFTINSVRKDGSLFSQEFKDEFFSDEPTFKTFIESGKKLLSVTDHNKHFKNKRICNPYELVNVKLQVQDSWLKDKEETFGFLPIPGKISEHFEESEKCELKLKIAKASTKDSRLYPDVATTEENVFTVACTNVELKVKPHLAADNAILALEFANTAIDDLIIVCALNTKVKSEKDIFLKSISLFIKVETETEKFLIKIPVDDLSVVKTNLSPKTHPPIILPKKFQENPEVEEDTYISKVDSIRDFVRLVWEGMTTNNGGFYFVAGNDKVFEAIPAAIKSLKEISFIISFESNPGPIFGFNNYFKINNSNVVINGTKSIFASIKENEFYLYTSVFISDNNGKYTVSAKEYHSTLPPHCLSFEIQREKNSNDEMYHYIPVDFELKLKGDSTETLLIDKNLVIPIMPKTGKIDFAKAEGPDNIALFYNHVTPLISYKDDNENINRYSAVGNKYSLNFSLRDIYGFRASDIPAVAITEYQHCYFDKIIPISAWPFVKCSYWFKNIDNVSSTWILKIELFKENAKKLISNQDKSIIDTLNTIKAQLTDNNLKIGISNFDPESTVKETLISLNDIKTQLLNMIKEAIRLAKNDTPSLNEIKIDFSVPHNGFKTIINPHLVLLRDVEDSIFYKLPDLINAAEQWDYNSIKKIRTKLTLSDSDKIIKDTPNKKLENALQKLDKAVQHPNFAIGVGVVGKGLERTPFIINKSLLPVSDAVVIKPEENYFGIRPYSKNLWSGKYNDHEFNNVDLDQGLKIILSKIDELLNPANTTKINKADVNSLNKLIACKKLIVKGNYEILEPVIEGDKKLSGELSDKVENMTVEKKKNVLEFDNVLLEKLSNFYNYDGIINIELQAKQELKPYRLIVDIADDVNETKAITKNNDSDIKKFKVQSSKLDYRKDKINWTILFDYSFNNDSDGQKLGFYNLDLKPKITHIEYDIRNSNKSGIEDSKWIELLTPIQFKKNIPITNFPATTREYPPQPVIVFNDAQQMVLENNHKPIAWSADLGKWKYLLGIKDDTSYSVGDRIHIKLKLKTVVEKKKFAPDDFRNFEGFISYWFSNDIVLNYSSFITELNDELKKPIVSKKPSTTLPGVIVKTNIPEHIILIKELNTWKIYFIDKEMEKRIFLIDPTQKTQVHLKKGDPVKIEHLVFQGLNIFPDPKTMSEPIVSIRPEIWVTRNENVINKNFIYQTPIALPLNWTTVHIRYLNAIFAKTSLKDVLNNLIGQSKKTILPFKSTAKFILNTGELTKNSQLSLPTLPVKQMEFSKDAILPNVDNFFNEYKNGYPAISLTIYNDELTGAENDLSVFFCNTIFKQHQ